MFSRRRLLAAAGALAAGGAPLPALADIKGEYVAFRFAMRGDQPVAAMTIGGSKPYLVLLDTGDTFGAALKKSIVEELKLDYVGDARTYGATGTDTVRGYRAHRVVFGGTLLQEDIEFMASDHVAGVDGIAPLGILTSRYTEMDFTEGMIRIATKGEPDHTGFRPLRIERSRAGGPLIAECLIDGIKARLLVDTGAAVTVSLNPSFVKAHNLWDGHPRFLPHAYRGVTGAVGRGRDVKMQALRLGPFLFQEPVVTLADPSIPSLEGLFDGILGIRLLRRFTLGFDTNASTLWLKPNDHLADPFPYDLSGLVEDFKNGACTVVEASKGSPSEEAGLKPGDKLMAIDTPGKFAALDRSLMGPVGDVRAFEIERGGQRMPIKMTLKDWL